MKEKKVTNKKKINIISIILGIIAFLLLGYILYTSVIWPRLDHCSDKHLVCNESKTVCYTYKEAAGKKTQVKWRGNCSTK